MTAVPPLQLDRVDCAAASKFSDDMFASLPKCMKAVLGQRVKGAESSIFMTLYDQSKVSLDGGDTIRGLFGMSMCEAASRPFDDQWAHGVAPPLLEDKKKAYTAIVETVVRNYQAFGFSPVSKEIVAEARRQFEPAAVAMLQDIGYSAKEATAATSEFLGAAQAYEWTCASATTMPSGLSTPGFPYTFVNKFQAGKDDSEKIAAQIHEWTHTIKRSARARRSRNPQDAFGVISARDHPDVFQVEVDGQRRLIESGWWMELKLGLQKVEKMNPAWISPFSLRIVPVRM